MEFVLARTSLQVIGERRLSSLLAAMGAGSAVELMPIFRRLLDGWGHRTRHELNYTSNVADDGAPFEFSIALSSAETEVQFYVEPLAQQPALYANMLEARRLVGALQREFGLSLTRFHALEGIFLPPTPQGPFTLWLGVSCTVGRAPMFKVYLNPLVRGRENLLSLMADTMAVLGFERAWAAVSRGLARETPRFDEPCIVCLDLLDSDEARVKVYIKHYAARVSDLERNARFAVGYREGDATHFYGALADGPGPFTRRPPITELAFTAPGHERPSSSTLEFPVGSYVRDDAEACTRVTHCLRAFGIDPAPYHAALHGFAERPLSSGAGLHAHVTLRRLKSGAPRIALYLASEPRTIDAHTGGG